MKKKSIYIIISTLTLAVTLLSCSNLLDKTPVQKGQITITLNTPGRTVSPVAAVDITAITEWDVTVTQNETEVLKEKLSAQNGSISIQLPAGTYTFSVEGTAAGTDGNSDVTFSGSAENVPVNSQTASVSIVVYPKKTEGGTGDFSYTINLQEIYDLTADAISAFLKPLSGENDFPLSIEIKMPAIPEEIQQSSIVLSGNSVPSGFYLLSIDTSQCIENSRLPLDDVLIEICDGATTTGSADNIELVSDGQTVKYVSTSATGTGDGSRPWHAGTIADFVGAATDGDQIDLVYVDETVPPVAFTDRDTDGTVIIWLYPNDDSFDFYPCTLSVSSGTKTLSINAAHLAEQGGISVAKGNQIELLETTLSDGETIVLTLDETSSPDVGDTIISENCTEEIAQRFLVGDGSKYKISSSGTLISAETPYAAWNQQRVLYVANTAADLLSASPLEVAMTDFCFDWDNNIYVCTSNPEIIKIPQGETTEATSISITGPTNTVSIACDNGNLYVLECSAEQPPTVRLWQYKCANFDGTETSVSGTPIELSASGLDLSVHKPVIAAADGTVYLAAPYADNTWKISAWIINDDGTTITAEQKYSSDVDLLSSTDLTAVDTSDDIGATSVDWYTFRVSDLLVQDGAVYALLNEVTNDAFTTFSPNTSRGAVVKLTDTGSALSVDTGFGSNGLLGWTAAPQSLPYGDAADSTTVDCYWPADNTNGFYGPAKFVAVKPKKLVIADDGATGSPGTTTSPGIINQKDRIVEVDLSSGAISETASFTEDQPINFDISVSGGSGWFD